MSYNIDDLLHLLDLEPIEFNIYRGRNRDIGSGRVFGGQVMAQALVAAQRTVDEGRIAHSMHGYFILPGELDKPIVYFVDRLRDGKSFTTRRVTAIQNGQAVFNMSASFHRPEDGMDHQSSMPDVTPPEELKPEIAYIRENAHFIPESVRDVLTQDRPFDFRVVDMDPFDDSPQPPVRRMWLRAVGEVPAEVLSHQAALTYASDYGILATTIQPHGLVIRSPGLQAATLDHSIWFHRPFRVDDWMLYVMDSPSAAGARGFARGSIFTRDGVLVASIAQEGLIRVRNGGGSGRGSVEGSGSGSGSG